MPRKQILLYLDTQLLFPIVVPRKQILLFLEVTGKHKHIKKPIVVPRNYVILVGVPGVFYLYILGHVFWRGYPAFS